MVMKVIITMVTTMVSNITTMFSILNIMVSILTTTMVSIITTILVQVTMGTTAAESMNASANIFLGQSEAPLMIRPYLKVIIVVIIFAIIVLKILYLL